MNYVKFFAKNLTDDGFTYKLGRNVAPNPLEGFQYCSYENMFDFFAFRPIIGFITIDDKVPIVKSYTYSTIFTSPEINIVEFRDFKEWITSEDWILNKDEKLQLASVKNNGNSIHWFKNPSEKVQLAAVKRDPSCIQFIKRPSEKVQLAAVSRAPDSIYSINFPYKSVYRMVKRRRRGYIGDIKAIIKYISAKKNYYIKKISCICKCL